MVLIKAGGGKRSFRTKLTMLTMLTDAPEPARHVALTGLALPACGAGRIVPLD